MNTTAILLGLFLPAIILAVAFVAALVFYGVIPKEKKSKETAEKIVRDLGIILAAYLVLAIAIFAIITLSAAL